MTARLKRIDWISWNYTRLWLWNFKERAMPEPICFTLWSLKAKQAQTSVTDQEIRICKGLHRIGSDSSYLKKKSEVGWHAYLEISSNKFLFLIREFQRYNSVSSFLGRQASVIRCRCIDCQSASLSLAKYFSRSLRLRLVFLVPPWNRSHTLLKALFATITAPFYSAS